MKILIAYYSWSGNTRRIATLIREETGGDLFEIVPVVPYTENYGEVTKQSKKEIKENYRPDLKNYADVSEYDAIFIGTPNWWSTMAPPVASFIANANLSGKIVTPFCTHGGGGLASCERDIARAAASAKIAESYVSYERNGCRADVSKWLEKLELTAK